MFLKKRNISSKIKRSKVTDYAALSDSYHGQQLRECKLKQATRARWAQLMTEGAFVHKYGVVNLSDRAYSATSTYRRS